MMKKPMFKTVHLKSNQSNRGATVSPRLIAAFNKKAPPPLKKILVLLCLPLLGAILLIDHSVQKDGLKYIVKMDKVQKADAILVLGAYVFPDGAVSTILQDRLNKAVELYSSGKAAKIIVSGDHGRKEYDEVNTMKNYLKGLNIPGRDIFMDHAGFDTYNSIYRARDIFQVKRLIIVTQKYHLIRAVFVARKLGLDAYGVESDQQSYGRRMVIFQLREIPARVKDFFLATTFKPEPTFLGEAIPITGDGKATDDK